MSMRETLTATLKDAMKAGDRPRVSTVRLIQAALKDRDIEARGQGKGPIADAEIHSLIQKMIKQVQESHDIAAKAGRLDLADQARTELAILSSFLPQPLDEAETGAAVRAAIADSGASGVKDMGKVIALLKERHAGRLDFARVSLLVKAMLSG
jgi:uncharacterized protein